MTENAKYPQNLNGAMTERVGYFANTLFPTCNENQDYWANMQINISYRDSGVIPDFYDTLKYGRNCVNYLR